MALLQICDTGTIVTRYVSVHTSQQVNRITQTALDGTTYLQIIGSERIIYRVIAYVNAAGKVELMSAESTAAIVFVQARDGNYYGRIISMELSERMAGGWYQATLTLAKEHVT